MTKKLITRKGQLIGITGSICSGKSFALKFFGKMGFNTLSMDVVIHKAIKENDSIKQNILNAFPVASKDGGVCRAILGELVFRDKDAMQKLESILHPYTHSKIKNLAEITRGNSQSRSVVIEVPLLFEKNREVYFDHTICLSSSTKTMLKRASLRENMSQEKFMAILNNQMPPEEKIHKADYFIYNENRFYTLHALSKLITNGRFKRSCSRY